MRAYANVWKNAFNFSARTGTGGYWKATLVNIIITIVLARLAFDSSTFAAIAYIYSLLFFLPSLSLTIRRLRDAGRGWYNIFWSLIPLLGTIAMVTFMCQPSVEDNGIPVV